MWGPEGQSYGLLLWGDPVRQSYGLLLWSGPVGRSCGAFLWGGSLVQQSFGLEFLLQGQFSEPRLCWVVSPLANFTNTRFQNCSCFKWQRNLIIQNTNLRNRLFLKTKSSVVTERSLCTKFCQKVHCGLLTDFLSKVPL